MATKEERKNFQENIEQIHHEKNLNYIDSILYHCLSKGIEIELISSLIDPKLKKKIALDASKLNFLKKKKR